MHECVVLVTVSKLMACVAHSCSTATLKALQKIISAHLGCCVWTAVAGTPPAAAQRIAGAQHLVAGDEAPSAAAAAVLSLAALLLLNCCCCWSAAEWRQSQSCSGLLATPSASARNCCCCCCECFASFAPAGPSRPAAARWMKAVAGGVGVAGADCSTSADCLPAYACSF